jgi:excisionase family DNA binding protein
MLVPPKEAAARLGVSIATVRRQVLSGELRSVRIGRRRIAIDLASVAPMSAEDVAVRVSAHRERADRTIVNAKIGAS